MDIGYYAYFEVEYKDLNKIKYYFEKNNIEIEKQEFGENIKIFININDEKYENVLKNKRELNFNILSFGKINKKYIKNIDFS